MDELRIDHLWTYEEEIIPPNESVTIGPNRIDEREVVVLVLPTFAGNHDQAKQDRVWDHLEATGNDRIDQRLILCRNIQEY